MINPNSPRVPLINRYVQNSTELDIFGHVTDRDPEITVKTGLVLAMLILPETLAIREYGDVAAKDVTRGLIDYMPDSLSKSLCVSPTGLQIFHGKKSGQPKKYIAAKFDNPELNQERQIIISTIRLKLRNLPSVFKDYNSQVILAETKKNAHIDMETLEQLMPREFVLEPAIFE